MSRQAGVFLIFLLFLIVLISDCGYYSFSGSTLPGHIKTISVPTFGNRTSEFGVPEDLTDALIAEFTKDNTLKVTDRRTADSMIRGEITNIRDQAGAYNQNEQVSEIKVYVTVNVAFEDLKKNQTFWEEQITQWGTYNPDVAAGQGSSTRQEAIQEALDKIVTDIFNKTVSNW
ncbi:MAG: LptE family protein [Calditrichaeota bacterium]|nr:LptE family protein [Calditrichota bacterium]